MGEAVAVHGLRHLDHEARADRLLEGTQEALGVEPAHALEDVEPELATDDRRDDQHARAVGRQPVEPPTDHLAHALRDARVDGQRRQRVLEAPLGDQQAHDLGHEEGVALGLAVERADEARFGDDAGRHLDVAADVTLGQPGEDDARGRGRAGEVAERVRERMRAVDLDVPVGADHEQWDVRGRAGEELQHRQRRLVGPMEVVEDEEERRARGGVGEEGRDAVEETKARLLRHGGRRRRDTGQPQPHLGHQVRNVRRRDPEILRQRDRIAGAGETADDLHPRPESGCALPLLAASPEHGDVAHLCRRGELGGGAGLPDSGLTDHETDAGRAGERLVQAETQLAERVLAPDEHAARQAIERILPHCGDRLGRDTGRREQPTQLCTHRAGTLRAGRGILGEQAQDQHLERRRHVGGVPRGRDRLRVQVLRDDCDRVVPDERRASGHQLVQEDAERVEVRAGIGGPAERLLRGHVQGGSGKRPGGRGRGARTDGEPEVTEPRAAVAPEPHVRGFDVAVHDAADVQMIERATEVVGGAQHDVERQAAAGRSRHRPGERAAVDVLAGDERVLALGPDVVHRDEVRMRPQAGGDRGLAANALERRLVAVGLHLRHHDVALEPLVANQPDALAPGLGEELADVVAVVGEGRGGSNSQRHAAPAAEGRATCVEVGTRRRRASRLHGGSLPHRRARLRRESRRGWSGRPGRGRRDRNAEQGAEPAQSGHCLAPHGVREADGTDDRDAEPDQHAAGHRLSGLWPAEDARVGQRNPRGESVEGLARIGREPRDGWIHRLEDADQTTLMADRHGHDVREPVVDVLVLDPPTHQGEVGAGARARSEPGDRTGPGADQAHRLQRRAAGDRFDVGEREQATAGLPEHRPAARMSHRIPVVR